MPRTEPVTVPVRGDDRFSGTARTIERNVRRWGTAARGVNTQFDQLNRTVERMGRSTRQLRTGFASLFAAQTVRRVGQYANSLIAASSALQEQADALGVASDELEVFQRVLEGDGATIQQVNQGLAFLTHNIGQAAVESTRASREFERWGVRIRNADGSIRSSLSVYRDLVGALEDVDEATRAAVLGITLGEEAARTFAASASRGLEAFDASRQRERGIGVATEEDNQALKALGDQVRQLQATVSTFGRVLLASFNVQIGELLARVQEIVTALVSIQQNSNAVTEVLLEVVERIRRLWRAISLGTQVLATVFVISPLRTVIAFLRPIVGAAVRGFRALWSNFTLIRSEGIRVLGVFRGFRAIFDQLLLNTRTLTTAIAGLLGFGAVFALVGRLREVVVDVFRPFTRLQRAFDTLPGSTLRARDALQSLERTLEAAAQVDPEIAARFESEVGDVRRAFNQIENNRLGPPAPGFTDEYLRGAERRIALAANTLSARLQAALIEVPDVDLGDGEPDRLVARVRRGIARLGVRPLQLVDEEQATAAFDRVQRRLNEITLQPLTDQFNRTAAAASLVADRLDDPAYLSQVSDTVNAASDAVERLNARLAALVEAGTITQSVADAIGNAFGETREAAANLADFLSTLGQSIGDAFADAILQAESLNDVLNGLLDTIVRAASSAFIGAPLAAFFSNLAGRQHGGPVVPGQGYIVGEQGPELLTVGRRGFVTPNNRLGGGGDVFNINVGDNADREGVRSDMMNLRSLIRSEVLGVVSDPAVVRGIRSSAA